jgi:short-subunit dehydrogenase
MDLERYGPWALVIGGSEGIGEHYARMLAADGFRLVLAARKPGPLEKLAGDLRLGGAEVRTVSVDMSEPGCVERLRAVTDDVEVGLLIYNAGANSTRGNFVELDPAVYRSVLGVNVIGVAECVHHYGALMRPRGHGGIILSGSGASYIGMASLASYCGSKAFIRIFSEALWAECEPFGIDVLHFSIGGTATPAMERLGYDMSVMQSPAEAAKEALDNIRNGPVWIPQGQENIDRCLTQQNTWPRADIVRQVSGSQPRNLKSWDAASG